MRTLGSDNPPNAAYFLRADRAKSREWLSYNLTVEFGKRLGRFEEHDNGVTVFFEDGFRPYARTTFDNNSLHQIYT
jgi:hypothetical protein